MLHALDGIVHGSRGTSDEVALERVYVEGSAVGQLRRGDKVDENFVGVDSSGVGRRVEGPATALSGREGALSGMFGCSSSLPCTRLLRF
jgi:hypothetical protein